MISPIWMVVDPLWTVVAAVPPAGTTIAVTPARTTIIDIGTDRRTSWSPAAAPISALPHYRASWFYEDHGRGLRNNGDRRRRHSGRRRSLSSLRHRLRGRIQISSLRAVGKRARRDERRCRGDCENDVTHDILLWHRTKHQGFGRYGTAAVGATSASRLAWIPYAARRSCPTPQCRWLRSACSTIRAQCWAKLSRESNVSGSEVTSAIFRQSHATSLYSSAAFIGIAKALLCASPVPCACNGIPALAVPGSRPKTSNGNVLWNWSIAKIYVRPQLVEIRA